MRNRNLSVIKKRRQCGFRARSSTLGGRKVLARRRGRGRVKLSS